MARSIHVLLVLTLILLSASALTYPAQAATLTADALTESPGLDAQTGRVVSGTVWYQGFLADSGSGDPINGTVDIVAELFNQAADGTSLWGPETHSSISVAEGWFHIELGSIDSPLPDFASPPYYLQLTVNGEIFDMRQKLASVPSAIRAGDVDGGGGGGIGGGGDTGYLPVFTSSSEIGNSVVLQTSGRISIDSSTSDAKLRVESAGGLPPVKIVNTSDGNVPSMLHIERTQEPASGDEFIYMTAPSTGYDVNFIQCDIGTAKTLETKFSVRTDGFVIGNGFYSESGTNYPVYAKAATGNTYYASIYAVYEGVETFGSAVRGVAIPGTDKGYGGDFTGGLCGVSGWASGSGISSYAGVSGRGDAASTGDSYGVYAVATGGTTSYGIYADTWGTAPTQWAGYFDGNVHSTGAITSAKSGFEIDHPGDPANAYLRHAYVASPEMKTVTDGTILLDSTGRATVSLPDWFDALNSNVRYQLTAIGGAAPNLHIESELSGNTFTIAGGAPGMKVCWLVTGIRKDHAAIADPLTVEAAKPFNERGKYVTPSAFGATKKQGIGHREIKGPPRDR